MGEVVFFGLFRLFLAFGFATAGEALAETGI